MSAELAAASAFTTFELQCCQLQVSNFVLEVLSCVPYMIYLYILFFFCRKKIDVLGLSVNQRTLFFCNVFNTLTGLIVHCSMKNCCPDTKLGVAILSHTYSACDHPQRQPWFEYAGKIRIHAIVEVQSQWHDIFSTRCKRNPSV